MSRVADPSAPPVTCQDVAKCQIHEWYPVLSKVSLKTKFVDLPPEFVDYLLSDGVVLPKGCETGGVANRDSDADSWSSDSDEEWDGTAEGGQASQPDHSEIVEKIRQEIAALGGEVFPKLNWSAPRDAVWINAGENTRCVGPSDLILLLKSSDFIVHDLCHAFDCCADYGRGGAGDEAERGEGETEGEGAGGEGRGGSNEADGGEGGEGGNQEGREEGEGESGGRRRADRAAGVGGGGGGVVGEGGRPERVVLALRKWFEMRTSLEFRCFVRGGKLVAISQRDCSNCYEFLADSRQQITGSLTEFFRDALVNVVPLKSFAFDAYIRQRDWRVFLVDINPLGGLTQPLLFSWPEIMGTAEPNEAGGGGGGGGAEEAGEELDGGDGVELRLVGKGTEMRPGVGMYGRLPADLQVDMSDARGIEEFVRACREGEEALGDGGGD